MHVGRVSLAPPHSDAVIRQVAWLFCDCAGRWQPARYRLRGSDAVYVAVAIRFDTTLVTLDRAQRERAAAAITAVAPSDVETSGSPGAAPIA